MAPSPADFLARSLQLNPSQAALLERYGFDADCFARLQARLRSGDFELAANRVRGPVTAPEAADWQSWPTVDGDLRTRGEAAIAAGQVAVAVLNGGMATRFGGRVKGVVEALPNYSFLRLKLQEIRAWGPQVPVFLMNSFATEADTAAHLRDHDGFGLAPEQLHSFSQGISLRLCPEGSLFRDAQGNVSPYAPGHGDLLGALAATPGFARFVAQGGHTVLVSNVDNLGAGLDPLGIGVHLAAARPVTVEVARRAAGDTGGAPVHYQDRVQILEAFRLPLDFDASALPIFNTNTFVLDIAVVQNYPLTWFRADKSVAGAPVVQFERLLGELTGFAPTTYLEVPRDGAQSRFLPVKVPADLATVAPLLRTRFGLPA